MSCFGIVCLYLIRGEERECKENQNMIKIRGFLFLVFVLVGGCNILSVITSQKGCEVQWVTG